MSAVSDQPAPISLNLDTLDVESGLKPFVVVLGGKRYEFPDPYSLQQDVFEATFKDDELAKDFMTAGMSTSARKAFDDALSKLSVRKRQMLFNGYRDHYGVGIFPGNSLAS